MTIADAKKQLRNHGFDVKYTNMGGNENEIFVTDQVPKPRSNITRKRNCMPIF